MTMQRREYPGLGDALWAGTLENGLPIYVVPRPGFRRRQALLAVNYGAAARDFTLEGRRESTPAGTAHFLEHKMFDLPEGNAMSIFTARGADSNAWTAADMTAYYFECDELFEENLELLLRLVSTPYFTPESVEKERGIIAQEILMTEDDPSFVLYTDAMGALFERHPLRESVAGTVESIAGITPETLYACHRAFYRPSNAALCIVGDVEPERCAEAASRVEWTDGGGCAAPDFGPPEGLEPVKTRTERAMDVSEPLFTVAAKLCTALPQGEEASRLITAGALAARCLFGQSSEFYTSLYAEGLLRGDFYRDVSPLAGTLLFECGGASAEPGQVFERLCAALSAAAGRGLDAAGFERARRADYGVSLRMLNDADALVSALARCHFGGYGLYEGFEHIRAVTLGEAEAFVREYLRPERLAFSLVNPKERT